jgi:hypothetical protein
LIFDVTIFFCSLGTLLEADEQKRGRKELQIAIAWNYTEKPFSIDKIVASLEVNGFAGLFSNVPSLIFVTRNPSCTKR